MLKRNVIASGITNLTDARYFASFGVEYILYDLKNIGINDIMAITEWIEGVKTLVNMNEDNIHFIEEVMLRVSPYAIGSSSNDCLGKILQYTTEGHVFHIFPSEGPNNKKIILTHVDNINPDSFHIQPDSHVHAFSEVMPTKEGLEKFLEQSEAGVILYGSSEIETGLKSFDNMDLLLEFLEED